MCISAAKWSNLISKLLNPNPPSSSLIPPPANNVSIGLFSFYSKWKHPIKVGTV